MHVQLRSGVWNTVWELHVIAVWPDHFMAVICPYGNNFLNSINITLNFLQSNDVLLPEDVLITDVLIIDVLLPEDVYLSDNRESRDDTESSVRWRRPNITGWKLRTFKDFALVWTFNKFYDKFFLILNQIIQLTRAFLQSIMLARQGCTPVMRLGSWPEFQFFSRHILSRRIPALYGVQLRTGHPTFFRQTATSDNQSESRTMLDKDFKTTRLYSYN